jgi:hypothetical protein
MKNTLVYLHALLTLSVESSWNAVYFYSWGDPANLQNREVRIRESEGRLCDIIVDRNSLGLKLHSTRRGLFSLAHWTWN